MVVWSCFSHFCCSKLPLPAAVCVALTREKFWRFTRPRIQRILKYRPTGNTAVPRNGGLWVQSLPPFQRPARWAGSGSHCDLVINLWLVHGVNPAFLTKCSLDGLTLIAEEARRAIYTWVTHRSPDSDLNTSAMMQYVPPHWRFRTQNLKNW